MEKTTVLFASFDCSLEKFTYITNSDAFNAVFDSRAIWQIFRSDGICSFDTSSEIEAIIKETSVSDEPVAKFIEVNLMNRKGEWGRYCMGFICLVPHGEISITITYNDVKSSACAPEVDSLTGLMSAVCFCQNVNEIVKNKDCAGKYAVIYFDIISFKAINDTFGSNNGDSLLIYIADIVRNNLSDGDMSCRITADRFAVFMDISVRTPEEFIKNLEKAISGYDLPIEITFNAGIYLLDETVLSAEPMIDRAVLAQSKIKGSYTKRFRYYDEAMRSEMLSEQETIGMAGNALAEKQFVVYYQPQFNHSTGSLIGAEALVRWCHPEKGMISPGVFIPIFEKNGFITNLDLFVFEEVCAFIRRSLDSGASVVPVSVNFSRYDIFLPDLVERIEAIREEYDIPVKNIRIELTESAIVGDSRRINEVIGKLHHCGYIVEMDDFGSGYSSLNVLKDIELDIIKLDMQFLSEKTESKKGGTILSSVVRMAKWLSMPVIAEGVESVEQADFLRSIGCNYIQGYLYSRPLPEEKYLELVSGSTIGATVPQMHLIETLNACNFWNPKSIETLIFSNFVGGAAIFDYHDGKIEVLRVNKKYLEEIHMNMTEEEVIKSDAFAVFDESNKKVYLDMLERAIETEDEQECETWCTINSSCCGEENFCIRSNVRMIGKSGENYLFYAMIRNITEEKRYLDNILDSEYRFKIASEQVKIYYWEYNLITREMRPCFRCMRDLGLPPLVKNYPEPLIEKFIFPPECADDYRNWLKQLDEGVGEMEGIYPLTLDRIPFRVRYTTEFDESGKPIKAYGSAALIVD